MQLSLYTGRDAVNPVPYSQPRRSYTDSVMDNSRVDHGRHQYARPYSRASERTVYQDRARHDSELPEVYHPSREAQSIPEVSRFDQIPASPNLHHSWMPTANKSEYDPPAFQPQTTAPDYGHQQDDYRSVDHYRDHREDSPHSRQASPMRRESYHSDRSSSPVLVDREAYSRSPSRESHRSGYTENGYRGPSFAEIVTERRRVPRSDSSEDSYDRRKRRDSGTRSSSPRALRTDYRAADDSWYLRRPRSQNRGSKPQRTSAIIIISTGTNLVEDIMSDLFSK